MPCRASGIRAILPLLLSTLAAAQDPKTAVAYDVRFLVAPRFDPHEALRSIPDAVHDSATSHHGGVFAEGGFTVELDWLAEFVAAVIDPEEDGDARVEVGESGILWVHGGTATHLQVTRLLKQLRGYFLEQIVLEVHVLPGSVARGRAGILSKVAAGDLLRSVGPHPIYVSRATLGGAQLLQSNDDRTYLKSYWVEIFNGSRFDDPAVAVLRMGAGWQVRTEHTHDGRILVGFRGQQAEAVADPTPRSIQATDAKPISALQLPTIRLADQGMQAVLDDGEAVLVGSSSKPDSVWCLRLRRPERAAPPAGPGFAIVSVPELVGAVATRAHRMASIVSPGEATVSFQDDDDPLPRIMEAGRLQELLAAQLSGDAAVESYGRMLILRGSDAELAAAREQLAKLAASATRQVTVEVRWGPVDLSELPALLDTGAEVASLADRLPNSGIAGTLLQDWFGWRVGTERSIIGDQDVEIGMDVSGPIPIVEVVFDGVSLRGQVLPVAPDTYRLALHFASSEPAEVRPFDPLNPHLGAIDILRLRSADFAVAPIVDANRWMLVHASPVQGSDTSLVVMVRVR